MLNRILFYFQKVADLKQQVGMMDARASQMFLEDEEFDESNFLKDGSKSAQISTISGFTSNTTSMRSNIDSRNRTDLRRLEKDKKEKLEVSFDLTYKSFFF